MGVLWTFGDGLTLSAHQLAPEVTAYFQVNGPRLRALVRLPTGLVADAGLPVIPPGYLDVSRLEDPLAAVVDEVVRSLNLTDGGRALPSPVSASWRITAQSDRSFATLDAAVRHLAEPRQPVDSLLYWNETFIDVQLDFEAATPITRLIARLNGLGPAREPARTTAIYVPAAGPARNVTVSGPPERIRFEPTLGEALAMFGRRAIDRLGRDVLYLLFLLCLAIPRLSRATLVAALAVGGFAHLIAVVAMQIAPFTLDASWRAAAAIAAGASLVGLAAINVVGVRTGSQRALAAVFGATSGVATGVLLREAIALAGVYKWPSIVIHELLLLAASLALLAVASRVVRLAYWPGLPAWGVAACLSAVPAHEGSHAMLEASAELSGLDLPLSNPTLAVLTRYWFVVAMAITLLVVIISHRSSGHLDPHKASANGR